MNPEAVHVFSIKNVAENVKDALQTFKLHIKHYSE